MNFLTQYAQYLPALVGVCSILASVIPQKTVVGKAVHFVAFNFGQASNAPAQDQKQ